jgi:hypothetical protein
MALDPKQADAWRARVELADAVSRLQRTSPGSVGAAARRRAVTPMYHWMQEQSALDVEGKVSAADAVRLATTVIRSERFGDGNVGAAVNTGVLQAVVAALAAWYLDRLD